MTPDCAEDCEIRTGADHPPPIARSHPDAMKESQPSLQRAADNLRRAYSLRAAVCHSVETKQKPSRLAANMGFSVSKKAGIRPATDGAAQNPLKLWSSANPLGHKSKCDAHVSLRQRNLHLAPTTTTHSLRWILASRSYISRIRDWQLSSTGGSNGCFCASNKRPLTVPMAPLQCCAALSMPP